MWRLYFGKIIGFIEYCELGFWFARLIKLAENNYFVKRAVQFIHHSPIFQPTFEQGNWGCWAASTRILTSIRGTRSLIYIRQLERTSKDISLFNRKIQYKVSASFNLNQPFNHLRYKSYTFKPLTSCFVIFIHIVLVCVLLKVEWKVLKKELNKKKFV